MIIPNMPEADYHAHPSIGSSTAKLFTKSPTLFGDAIRGLYRTPDSPAFQIGRIVHMAVLEPDRFAEQVTSAGPINPKTGSPYGRDTKAWAEWQALNPGIIVVDKWVHLAIDRMPQVVADIYRDGVAESSAFVNFACGVDAKCRPDWLAGTDITDLKTIDDVDRAEQSISRFKYWLSHAWYRAVMKQMTGKAHSMRFVFVEKKPPYRWRIVTLDAAYVTWADEQVDTLLGDLGQRLKNDDWSDSAEIAIEAPMPAYLDADEFVMDEEGISL